MSTATNDSAKQPTSPSFAHLPPSLFTPPPTVSNRVKQRVARELTSELCDIIEEKVTVDNKYIKHGVIMSTVHRENQKTPKPENQSRAGSAACTSEQPNRPGPGSALYGTRFNIKGKEKKIIMYISQK